MSDTILGIHSNRRPGMLDPVTGTPYDPSLTDGHAWLSVTRDGTTTNYGLWPDGHPRTPDNGSGTDIRVGMEDHDVAAASRFYRLTPEQTTALEAKLRDNVEWGRTSNCSSWASETLTHVTGVRISADEPYSFGIVETPRVLGESIYELKKRERTSRTGPAATPTPSRSSSTFSDAGGATPAVEHQAALSPIAQALASDSDREVRQFAQHHNVDWDQGMDNTVYAVAQQARADGLTAITHFNLQDGQIRYGQLDGHILKDGSIDARLAANIPEAESRVGLMAADRAAEQQAAVQVGNPQYQPEQIHHRV